MLLSVIPLHKLCCAEMFVRLYQPAGSGELPHDLCGSSAAELEGRQPGTLKTFGETLTATI